MIRARLRAAICAATMASVAVGGASCATGHATLGTGSGTCFLALPTASATVNGAGKLIGLRSFKPKDLVAKLQRSAAQRALSGDEKAQKVASLVTAELAVFGTSEVCAVEYEGSFKAGSVRYAVDPSASGRYAIVVTPVKGGTPTVSFVAEKLPLALKHFF